MASIGGPGGAPTNWPCFSPLRPILIDIVFKGIEPCEMNTVSWSGLADFLPDLLETADFSYFSSYRSLWDAGFDGDLMPFFLAAGAAFLADLPVFIGINVVVLDGDQKLLFSPSFHQLSQRRR